MGRRNTTPIATSRAALPTISTRAAWATFIWPAGAMAPGAAELVAVPDPMGIPGAETWVATPALASYISTPI